MKLQFYNDKLINSEEYKKFMKEHKDAYFCSGFFSIDKENSETDNQIHFDFYIPSSKEMFSFKLNDKIELTSVKIFDERIPEQIFTDFNIDLDKFEKIILKKMELEKIKNSAKKFLFSLQNLEKKTYLLVTIFLSNLGLLKINIDLAKGEIISFEKKSMSEIFKIFRKAKV